MIKPSSTISFKAATKAVNQLSMEDRLKLLDRLEKELANIRFERMIQDIRSKAKTSSHKKISAVVEKVRQELYDQRSQNGH